MKAIQAGLNFKTEMWSRLRSKIFRREELQGPVSLEMTDIPEPTLPDSQWVKIRSTLSGISDLDEAFIRGEASILSPYITFPFVPGNEILGIVTEVGSDAAGIEPGERVVVDPLLWCVPRRIQPLCESCGQGRYSVCRHFGTGPLGPGVVIGACRATFGGWGDYFLAHRSQIRSVPNNMESDQAILVPEFARALRAVFQNKPSPADKVIIMGAGSLGLMLLSAIRLLGFKNDVLVITEMPFQTEMVRKLGYSGTKVVPGSAPDVAFEEAAEFTGGSVHYSQTGRMILSGGAELVFETTGNRDRIDDAMRMAGEEKKVVLASMNHAAVFDATPLWIKNIIVVCSSWSGTEIHEGGPRETFDIAMELVGNLPYSDFITHKFKLDNYAEAFNVIKNRFAGRAIKVIFQHVF